MQIALIKGNKGQSYYMHHWLQERYHLIPLHQYLHENKGQFKFLQSSNLMHHWLQIRYHFIPFHLKRESQREHFERTESSSIIAIKEYWLWTKCVGMCHFGSHQWWNCLHYDTWLSQSKPNRHISYFESVFRSQKVAESPESYRYCITIKCS